MEVTAQSAQNTIPEYNAQRKARSRIGNFIFVLFRFFI